MNRATVKRSHNIFCFPPHFFKSQCFLLLFVSGKGKKQGEPLINYAVSQPLLLSSIFEDAVVPIQRLAPKG